MAIDPAMLLYLDNETNVAGRPNENFARELMELFLLGRANYAEADVAAMARAWTGHGYDSTAETYRGTPPPRRRPKTIFGITRNWDGPETITEMVRGSKQAVLRPLHRRQGLGLPRRAGPGAGAPSTPWPPPSSPPTWRSRRSCGRCSSTPSSGRRPPAPACVRSPVEWMAATMQALGLTRPTLHPEWWVERCRPAPLRPAQRRRLAGRTRRGSPPRRPGAGASFASHVPVEGQRRRASSPATGSLYPATAAAQCLRPLRHRRPLAGHPRRARGLRRRRAARPPRVGRPARTSWPSACSPPTSRWPDDATDLEYPEIQARLSTPGRRHPRPGRPARASSAARSPPARATALLPSWMDDMAAAATPIGADDGVLVRPPARRRQRRAEHGRAHGGPRRPRPLPVPAGQPRRHRPRSPLADGLGLHPGLPKLKARYDAGKVAVVRGVGQTASDLSHFTSTATWMAGTSDIGADDGLAGPLARRRARVGRRPAGRARSARRCRSTCGADVGRHRARDRGGDLYRRRPQRAVDEARVRRRQGHGRGHHRQGPAGRPGRRHRRRRHRPGDSASPRSSRRPSPTGRWCRRSPWPPGSSTPTSACG